MKRFISHIGLLAMLSAFIPNMAMAGGCYVDPVQQYSGTGMIKSGVYLRSEACTSGTMVLKTLSAGTAVTVIAHTDGWYAVLAGGKHGWIGEQFLNNNASQTGKVWSTYEEYQVEAGALVSAPTQPEPVVTTKTAVEVVYTGEIGSRGLIKLVCPSVAPVDHPCKAVYYIGTDAKRHAFPNGRVFATWYANFDDVKAVNADRLGQYALGANITYRPGVRMVKFTTDPKVYAVARGGVLRWVKTEAAAIALYGSDWNKKIDDIADAFYANYNFGTDIESTTDFSPASEMGTTPTFD
jgi:hypothetical protein